MAEIHHLGSPLAQAENSLHLFGLCDVGAAVVLMLPERFAQIEHELTS